MKLSLTFGVLLFCIGAFPASAVIDENENGLSDLWELKYNNNQLFPDTFDPSADPDGDGWTNAQEAVAGTDPFDANSPGGCLRPQFSHIPAVLGDIDESGTPCLITPEAVTITWLTIPGKQYTLLYSPDLGEGSWLPLEESFIGNGSEVAYNIPLTQPDGTTPDSLFWRVSIEDVESDGDGLTDAEECALGTNPLLADSDGDGLNDHAEILAGTSSTNPDTDGDGIPDNIDANPLVPDRTDFTAALLMVISPQQ